MAQELWWASPSFWRKSAIWVTGFSFVILIFLTFDTMWYIKAGGKQVPGYSIINKLGGHIRFESEIGKGTEFIIQLPVGHHE